MIRVRLYEIYSVSVSLNRHIFVITVLFLFNLLQKSFSLLTHILLKLG